MKAWSVEREAWGLFGEGLLYMHGERYTIVPDVSWFHTLFTQRSRFASLLAGG